MQHLCVCTNIRMILRYAEECGRPALRFNYDCASFAAQSPGILQVLRSFSADSVGYYVQGAPIMIFENVSTLCGVSNGVCGRLVGFRYEDEEKQRRIQHAIENAAPGSFLDVDAG